MHTNDTYPPIQWAREGAKHQSRDPNQEMSTLVVSTVEVCLSRLTVVVETATTEKHNRRVIYFHHRQEIET